MVLSPSSSRGLSVTEDGLMLRAQGLLGEAYPRSIGTGAQGMGTGDSDWSLIGLLAGTVVTNVHFFVTTADAGATLCRVGLYSAAGALLAGSANTVAALASTGMKTVALTTPHTVSADAAFYIGMVVAFPTALAITGLNTTAARIVGIGSGQTFATFVAGQADLPAALVLSNVSAALYWFAVS